ncbi:MAG: hypothetical protein C4519_04615 [Desulfobacteraceae bacterium]|nr:MAG: hypothetical protein C4519_04615 [Desulfobacteraceae bacterium]
MEKRFIAADASKAVLEIQARNDVRRSHPAPPAVKPVAVGKIGAMVEKTPAAVNIDGWIAWTTGPTIPRLDRQSVFWHSAARMHLPQPKAGQ